MNIIENLKYIKKIYLLFACISFSLNAYEVSNGVPDPMDNWLPANFSGIPINPISGNAPASWEIAKQLGRPSYYIDSNSPNATNSNNTYGTPDKPRASIPEITYDAGSYIEIHGGPYSGGGQLILTANGTADNPVWIRGMAIDEPGEISGEMIIKGQYVILENLKFINQKLGFRLNNNSYLHHAVIRNSSFVGTGELASSSSSVIAVEGSVNQRFHDIIIYNNEIHSYGKSFIDTDPSLGESVENDFHGVKVTTNADRIWILKNNIYNLGGDSVQIGNATVKDGQRVKDIYIADNDFYNNLENGVDIKAADDILISHNRIWGFISHKNNSSSGGAIIVHSKAANTWIVNNNIFNSAGGVVVTDSSLDTWIIGNVIKDISHPSWDTNWSGGLYESGSAIHFRGGSNGGAINNTIINYDKGLEAASGEYVFLNNILYERNLEVGKDIFVESTQSKNLVSNNLIFTDSFSLKQTNTSCILCLYTSPEFVDLLESEALTNTSGAIASGTNIQTYLNKYKNVFDIELSLDMYGGKRIVGGIEIGAVEDQSSSVEITSELPGIPEIINLQIMK